MQETITGTVRGVQSVGIHGLTFYTLVLEVAGERRLLRVPQDQLPGGAQEGEVLRVDLLLGQPTAVRRG